MPEVIDWLVAWTFTYVELIVADLASMYSNAVICEGYMRNV